MALAAPLVLSLAACAQMPFGGASSPTPTDTASATPTPTPTPTAASFTLEVVSGSTPLAMRNVPEPTGTALVKLKPGVPIIVDCTVQGAMSNGTQGATDRWDHLVYEGHSGYVSAAYVKGGADPAIPACPYTPAVSKTPKPVPPASGTTAEKVVAVATSQLGVAESGNEVNCNPYTTKCGDWNAAFAVWVWQQAGITIPPATKIQVPADIFIWGKGPKRSHDTLEGIAPGDLVFFGTGPTWNPPGRVEIVTAVFPDRLRTISGNLDDRVSEHDVPRSGIYGYTTTGA